MARAQWLTSATGPEGYPKHRRKEVALAGRSNVGKSSLVNALAGVKGLARTAKKPGRTQTLNFYAFDDGLSLVDLPGYGYANVPRHVQASWGPMIEGYLLHRDQLEGVVLLIDARHGPTDDDQSLWTFLAELPVQKLVVASKWDKVKRNRHVARLREMERALGSPVQVFSAVTGEGKKEIMAFLRRL